MEINVVSSLDGTSQPSLFYPTEGSIKRPLVVGLHSWSYDRFNLSEKLPAYAKKYNFNLLLPNFRGPNKEYNPEYQKACGSKYAIQDIYDAIEYVKNHYKIDENNVFLIGGSGGGHMALMCAANKPEFFKAVGAFCPVCDLKRWMGENSSYKNDVLACCNGDEKQMLERSPSSYAKELSQANLKIFHGKFDKSVPYLQSFDLYTEITKANAKARVFLDVFDGGHSMNLDVGFDWLLSQYIEQELTQITG